MLAEVKKIISFCVVLAYHLRLEVAYYCDRFAQLPLVVEKNDFRSEYTIVILFTSCYAWFYDINYIIIYYVAWYHIVLCYVILYYITFDYVILYYILLCYIMFHYIILYYIILYHIMLYYVILYYIILYYIKVTYAHLLRGDKMA